ncbi:hypothetical protein C5B85_12935 [Pseudoclavibacter sp. AY1F1]|nr:hypothetical protein C5B85_12935 [Pseudoclavibacter sp. AY1F1]
MPEGQIEAPGDNRTDSSDSLAACRNGGVDASCLRTERDDDVVGEVFSIVWPLPRFGGLWRLGANLPLGRGNFRPGACAGSGTPELREQVGRLVTRAEMRRVEDANVRPSRKCVEEGVMSW